MEFKANNEDYKKLDLGYLRVKIRGIEYKIEECDGKLKVTKISDDSECVLDMTMTQYTNNILLS